jgi:hypothetical protein
LGKRLTIAKQYPRNRSAKKGKLRCVATLYYLKCGQELPLPFHWGQPMHEEKLKEQEKLVCWMGPTCGELPILEHCGKPVLVKG